MSVIAGGSGEPRRLPYLETAALLWAAIGSIGSVFLSVGMGLNACPLCFYQRTFMFGVLGVLTVARLARGAFAPGAASLLAAPLAVAGLGVAAFHVSLEARGILECPRGVLGLGSSPLQSLLAFVLLCATVIPAAVIRTRTMTRRSLVLTGGCVLGVLLGAASLASAPPLPPPKDRPTVAEGYLLKGCEPPPAPKR